MNIAFKQQRKPSHQTTSSFHLARKTTAIAAATALGLGALKVPKAAAEFTLTPEGVNSSYVSLRMAVPSQGNYSIDFSPNLRDWYSSSPYSLSGVSYTSDHTKSFPGAPAKGFFRLRNIALTPPGEVFFQRYDPLLGMRIISSNGFQILQVKDVRTSIVTEADRIENSQGSFGNIGAANEMVGYTIRRSGQASQIIIKSLINPEIRFETVGELQLMGRRDYEIQGAVLVDVLKDFFSQSSGIKYQERFYLSADRQNFYSAGRDFTYSGAVYDDYCNIVAHLKRTPDGSNTNYEVDVYDVNTGVESPTKIYTTNIGNYSTASYVYLSVPRQSSPDQFVVVCANSDTNKETTVIDPRGQKTLKLPLGSYAGTYIFESEQAGFFGVNQSGGYAEAWANLHPLTARPGRSLPTEERILQNFDGTSVLNTLWGNDGAYSFVTATGEGVNGSTALRINFQKKGYPYSYIYAGLSDQAVDFSMYSSISLRVKNIGNTPLDLILKIESRDPNAHYVTNISHEKRIDPIPAQSGWTDVNLDMPQDGRRLISYITKSFLIFAAPGNGAASGSFLIDDIRLSP